MKLPNWFSRTHVVWLLLAVFVAGLQVYEHSSLFGNLHPAAPTRLTLLSWLLQFVVAVGGLLSRSPQDLWKVATGQLIPAIVAVLPTRTALTIPPPAPSLISSDAAPTVPNPAQRGFVRFEVLVLGGMVGLFSFIVIGGTIHCSSGLTGTKVATAGALGVQVECVYTKVDGGESFDQAAADCDVGVNDVFRVLSLFDKRAAARRLAPCTSTDGGHE